MSATTSRRSYDDSAGGAVAFGVAMFAGIMLITVSLFQGLQGIAAIAEDKLYVTGLSYTYELDVTAWGWIHLVVGVIGVAIGAGILMNQTWALAAGIALSVISAVLNFVFMPYYPFWAIVIIAFYGFVIWGLTRQLSGGDRPAS